MVSLHKIFHAACLEDVLADVKNFHDRYVKEFPTAVSNLADNLSDCLIFYRSPEIRWKRIRTTNVLDRVFNEVHHHTNVVGRFPNEMSALSMVFGVLEEDRLKWREVEKIKIGWVEKLAA